MRFVGTFLFAITPQPGGSGIATFGQRTLFRCPADLVSTLATRSTPGEEQNTVRFQLF